MPEKISTGDARGQLATLINRVAFGKESFILTRRGKALAALVTMDELNLLKELEDRMDIADAAKALEEPGEDIPAHAVWEALGLSE